MISCIIPCIPEHLVCLEYLLLDYSKNTILPTEVIVSLSGVYKIDKTILNTTIKKYEAILPNVVFLIHERLLNRADNRNIAIDSCKYELITFSDADDRVHPQRIETLLYFFQNHDIDCLIHSYTLTNCVKNGNNTEHCIFCKNKNRQYNTLYDFGNIDFVDSECIRNINFPDSSITPDVKNIIGWNTKYKQIHPHHGFSTVRRSVLDTVRFNSKYIRGQDSLFCQEVVYHGYKTMLVDADLMIYNNNWIPTIDIYRQFNIGEKHSLFIDLGSPNPPLPGKCRSLQEINSIQHCIFNTH